MWVDCISDSGYDVVECKHWGEIWIAESWRRQSEKSLAWQLRNLPEIGILKRAMLPADLADTSDGGGDRAAGR